MALAITEEHVALADVVREFATEKGVRAADRAVLERPARPGDEPDELWKQVVAQGWTGLHVAEEFGGSGYGLPELAIVLEGLGREVAAGPLLPTVVASALIAERGSAEQRAQLLPGLVGGTAASVALEPGVGLGAVWAGIHLVRTGEDVTVYRTAEVGPVEAADPGLGAGVVTPGDAGEVIPGAGPALTRLLRVAAAAQAAGGARATLDAALEYAKVREQFGRTIGSFQAIKHHLADMLVRSELAVAAAWDAARAEVDATVDGTAGGEADLAAATAAATALDSYLRNARMSIQVHGGIGFTWEHDAHLHLRRSVTLAAFAGGVDAARDDVAALSGQGVERGSAVTLPESAEGYRAAAREFRARYEAAPQDRRRALLVESGYQMPHWDPPFGRAAGPVEQLVIEEEFRGLELPDLGIGGWVLLTLLQTGSPEQIERWIAPGLRGEQTWCQLFSEPGAGSDAAAVSTRGVKVEGGWRVTGQKVWTSNAHNSQRGLATVRTNPDASKHKGITAMVIDLTAPGVTVRPLREITGDALFNEIFFDDVFVPDADVVGAPGEGWAVARATLANERVSIGGSKPQGIGPTDLLAVIDRRAPGDAALRREVGALIADYGAAAQLTVRTVERAVLGAAPSVEGNVSKLVGAELNQRLSELGLRIAGVAGVTGGEPELLLRFLFSRAATIAGGTSEVSRNVIAERILGLPREAIRN
jgi:alkylation response protein AidB-like acyl-CoA dehydrogenase